MPPSDGVPSASRRCAAVKLCTMPSTAAGSGVQPMPNLAKLTCTCAIVNSVSKLQTGLQVTSVWLRHSVVSASRPPAVGSADHVIQMTQADMSGDIGPEF